MVVNLGHPLGTSSLTDFDVFLISRAGGLGDCPGPSQQGGYQCSLFPPLFWVPLPTPVLSQQWIERVVGWLGKVFLQDGPARPTPPEAGPTLRRWRCHVQRFFYRIYAGLRIEELFSIIRGRPRLPAHLPCALALQFLRVVRGAWGCVVWSGAGFPSASSRVGFPSPVPESGQVYVGVQNDASGVHPCLFGLTSLLCTWPSGALSAPRTVAVTCVGV